MKKHKEAQVTNKEELVEYKLADYVNGTFVWSMLVTLPSCDSLQKIHKILCKKRSEDNDLERDLKNIDKNFFQILQLLYYYVTIGKDEQILVKYTVHTSVSLLTEAISKLSINGANHADRPLQVYGKMLKLEKFIKEFNNSILLQDDDKNDVNIRSAIQSVSEYLDKQFIVLDRVFSVIYLKYLEYTKSIETNPDLISLDPQFAAIHGILKTFFEQMRELIKLYPEHNFERLFIAADSVEATFDKNVILMTPEKQVSSSSIGKKAIQHTVAPDVTPTVINDDVKQSAAFIAKALQYHEQDKKIIFKPKTKKPEDVLEDLNDELFARMMNMIPPCDDAHGSSTSSTRTTKKSRKKLLFDITNTERRDAV